MRSTVLVLVALGCGLVASLGVYRYLEAASDKQQTQNVLVASNEININEPLNPKNVRVEPWPGRQLPQGALTELKQIDSKYARIRLYPGEPILSTKVMNWDDTSGSLKVPKGFRAVSVKVTMESSVSSLIEPGDQVDVIVVVKRSPDTQPMAKTILKAVQVFAVNSEMAKSPDKDKALEELRTVSLLLNPEQAEKLAIGQDLGILRLALRSPDDPLVDETRGCTVARLLGRGDVVEAEEGNTDQGGLPEAVVADESAAAAAAAAAAAVAGAGAGASAGWTMVIDSPLATQEYAVGEFGQPPRLIAFKDKTRQAPPAAPAIGPAAPAVEPAEQRALISPPAGAKAVEASWRRGAGAPPSSSAPVPAVGP